MKKMILIAFLMFSQVFALGVYTSSQVTVNVLTTGTKILASNAKTKYIRVYNQGSDLIYLGLASTPNAGVGLRVSPDQYYDFVGETSFQGNLYARSVSVTNNVLVFTAK